MNTPMMCAVHDVTIDSCRLDRREGCRYTTSSKQWAVRANNLRTGNSYLGDQRFTKEAAQAWANELNARRCNIYLRHTIEEVKA